MAPGEQLRVAPIAIHARIVQPVASVRIRLKNVRIPAILAQPMSVRMEHGAAGPAVVQSHVMALFAVNVKIMIKNVPIIVPQILAQPMFVAVVSGTPERVVQINPVMIRFAALVKMAIKNVRIIVPQISVRLMFAHPAAGGLARVAVRNPVKGRFAEIVRTQPPNAMSKAIRLQIQNRPVQVAPGVQLRIVRPVFPML